MKKQILTLSSIALAAPVATAIACGSRGPRFKITSKDKNPLIKEGAKKITGKTLAAVVSDPENPRWQKAKESLEINGREAGFKTKVEIKKNVNDQKSWIDLQKNNDAWIVGATDDSLAGSWKERNQDKPVIAYDRLVKTSNRKSYNWYVTYDNSLVGWYQGASILGSLYNFDFINDESVKTVSSIDEKTKAVKNLINTNENLKKLQSEKIVLAIGGDPADNNAKLFYDGGMNLIKAVKEVDDKLKIPGQVDTFEEVSIDKWDYSKGQAKLDTFIRAIASDKSKVAAVLSPNDGMATASINALKNNDLDPTKIYITGQDSNDTAIVSISQNTGQDMTIFKPDTKLSAIAVALAAKLVKESSFNVAPGVGNTTDQSGYAKIKEYINSLFDLNEVKFEIDGKQYETLDNKPINTILLSPQIVDSDNVKTLFDIDEK